MADLVAYLRARLDEEEATARLAWPGPWSYNPAKRWLEPDQLARERAGGLVLGGEEFVARRRPGQPVECVALTGQADDPDAMGTALHIATWGPDRVLAEIKAKRAILDEIERIVPVCLDPMTGGGIVALAMAQTYADRPDFDPAWSDRG